MYSVTDEFLQAIRFSSRRRVSVDVYFNDATEPILTDIPVAGGSLTIDRTSDIRRSGSITISSDVLRPEDVLPIGIEIRIKSGFHLYTGGVELVPLGVFRTEDVSWDEGANSTFTVTFFDRAKAHQDITVMGTNVLSGTTIASALTYYNTFAFGTTGLVPSIIVDPSFNTALTFPGGSVVSGTHLDLLKKIAEQFGGEQYFNVNGDHVFGTIPSVSQTTTADDTVWDVDVGESGVLVSASHRTSRTDTFNAVGVYGATIDVGTSDRVYAEAVDMSVLSPTYYLGNFGKKTMQISNDMLTTTAACAAVASEQLKNHQGLARPVSFTSLWNPALDVGDLVLFTFLDGSQEIHLIDSLSFDLASGVMSGQTRSVQYVV